MPVLQVPAGEEGMPGGLANLLKAEEEGWEKKKGGDNDEMGGRRG